MSAYTKLINEGGEGYDEAHYASWTDPTFLDQVENYLNRCQRAYKTIDDLHEEIATQEHMLASFPEDTFRVEKIQIIKAVICEYLKKGSV
jgi:hypothetical protein